GRATVGGARLAALRDRRRRQPVRHPRRARPRRIGAIQLLDQRVPLLAHRAPAQPLRLDVAAALASMHGARPHCLELCHLAVVPEPSDSPTSEMAIQGRPDMATSWPMRRQAALWLMAFVV